jgi:ABC-2 type transport system ATP-binding protein
MTIQDRKKDIEAFIATGDLSRAVRKTLDFARDFSPSGLRLELENEAIRLKQAFNESRDHAGNAATEETLASQITGFLTKVESEFGKADNQNDYSNQEQGIIFKGENLLKAFKKRRKKSFNLQIDAAIELRSGEITGVVGMNGSGKTTLLRIIAGELSNDGGTIEWSFATPGTRNYRTIRNQIGYVAQRPAKWNYTAWEILSLTASMHGIRGAANEHEVEFQLHRLSLENYRDSTWKELTGGFHSRFEVARALLTSPKLLVLDEPLAPLDVNTLQFFLQDLKDIAASLHGNCPIIISSQHLHEVEFMANRLIMLEGGKNIFIGPMSELGSAGAFSMFEISCPLTSAELMEKLGPLGVTNISEAGSSFVVTAPQAVQGAQILDALLKSGTEILYFRNISNSAKKMFVGKGGAF